MSYKPSEVKILVHVKTTTVGEDTSLVASPSEIGTETEPVDEGTAVGITTTLTKTVDGTPIEGKVLRLYSSDGTDLQTRVTDADGKAYFKYTAAVVDNGKSITIKYLGD